MSKENGITLPDEAMKKRVITALAKSAGEYLETDSDVSVSEAQMAAFDQAKNALPEGKLKEFAEKLVPVQGFAAKVNEKFLGIQDASWKILKPVLIFKAPLTALIPDKPFSKMAIKASRVGARVGEKIVKAVTSKTKKK